MCLKLLFNRMPPRYIRIDLDNALRFFTICKPQCPAAQDAQLGPIATGVLQLSLRAALVNDLSLDDFQRFREVRVEKVMERLAKSLSFGPSIHLLSAGTPKLDVALQINRAEWRSGRARSAAPADGPL